MTRLEPAALLPHRWPMALLDEADLIEAVPTGAVPTGVDPTGAKTAARSAVLVGRWTVRAEDPWCGAGGVPPPLVLESWLQACAVLVCAELGASASRVFVGGLRGARVAGPVLAGETVEHRVRLVRGLAATAVCAGAGMVAGRIVVTVEQASVSVESDARTAGVRPGGEARP